MHTISVALRGRLQAARDRPAGYGLADWVKWVFTWGGGNDSRRRCGMHRTIIWACLFGLIVTATACGDAAQEPDERADLWFESFADGDVEAFRDSLAVDAVFAGPNGESFPIFGDYPRLRLEGDGVDDFDGDGATSYADRYQAALALSEVTHLSIEWDCVTVTDDQAECTVTTTNVFVEAGGGPPYAHVWRLTFEDGKVAVLGLAGPVDPTSAEQAANIEQAERREYAAWVEDRYPDRYDALFHGPCCSSLMVRLPDPIAQHVELMTEYLESTG